MCQAEIPSLLQGAAQRRVNPEEGKNGFNLKQVTTCQIMSQFNLAAPPLPLVGDDDTQETQPVLPDRGLSHLDPIPVPSPCSEVSTGTSLPVTATKGTRQCQHSLLLCTDHLHWLK